MTTYEAETPSNFAHKLGWTYRSEDPSDCAMSTPLRNESIDPSDFTTEPSKHAIPSKGSLRLLTGGLGEIQQEGGGAPEIQTVVPRTPSIRYPAGVPAGVPISVAVEAVNHMAWLDAAIALPKASEVGVEASVAAMVVYVKGLRSRVEAGIADQEL